MTAMRRFVISQQKTYGKNLNWNIKGRSGPPLRMLLLIFAFSGEQLLLNVAGDSAQTLSVLGNMGDALDDCRLRFVQKCRRPPQNTPDFGGPTDFFEKLPSKPPPRISPTWPT